MKTKVFVLASMITLFAACTYNGVTQPKSLQLSPTEKELVQHCNDFSFNLLAQVANNEEQENVILSPLSASMLLGMLMNGADGETLAQIQTMTGFGNDISIDDINAYYKQLIDVLPELDKVTKLNIANGIWVREDFPVKDTFITACKDNFKAQARNVHSFTDENVLNDINSFVAQQTNNHIKKVIDASMVDDNTAMALLNALYFKSMWVTKFKKSNTRKGSFTTLKRQQIQTDMMHLSEEKFLVCEKMDYSMIELPYKGDEYCADIVMPGNRYENPDIDIREWIKSINDEKWQEMIKSLHKTEVDLAMPKFSIKYQRALKEDLIALGMKDAFDGAYADFSNLSDRPTYVSCLNQHTFMKVDEEGTEAAAVTISLMGEKASGYYFCVDRPFLFVIRERDFGTILFAAIIGHPEWQAD